jgi:hypothetical protein
MDQHAAQIRANVRRNRKGKGTADLTAANDPKYITTVEIAQRLGWKPYDVQNSIFRPGREMFHPVRKCGTTRYYDRAGIEAWIDGGARDRNGNYRIAPKAKP